MNTLDQFPIKNLQGRTQDITPEEVKAMPTFQHYTDEQIALLIQTIRTFTQIGYAIFSSQQKGQEAKIFSLSAADTTKQNAA